MLYELAERCEKATGPDRELDALIWRAVFAPEGSYVEQSPINGAWCIYYGVSPRSGKPSLWNGSHVQPVTESIDAAKTLLLDFLSIEMTESAAKPQFTRCRLWDWRRSPTMSDPGNEWKAEGNRPLPLNICAAALRARLAAQSGPAASDHKQEG